MAQYTTYTSLGDIPYSLERLLKEGKQMAGVLEEDLKSIHIKSKALKEVWFRDLESLKKAKPPTTTVAVCGATGAGKSTLLNAILEKNILPTSGMQACTSAVTRIKYHTIPTIKAKIKFITKDEWKEELSILLDNLVDEKGHTIHPKMDSHAAIAWAKVRTVYPSLRQDELATMKIRDFLKRSSVVSNLLGTVKTIEADDPESFRELLRLYVDSGIDTSSSLDSDNDDDADEIPEPQSTKHKKADPNAAAAYWPVISDVEISCNAVALSSGVVLIDLPGTGDANAARSAMYSNYLKSSDYVWIVAQISRAVDDRAAKDLLSTALKNQLIMGEHTIGQMIELLINCFASLAISSAKDGSYDPRVITFIATQSDDIYPPEIVNSLKLRSHLAYKEIQGRMQKCKEHNDYWTMRKKEVDTAVISIEAKIQSICSTGDAVDDAGGPNAKRRRLDPGNNTSNSVTVGTATMESSRNDLFKLNGELALKKLMQGAITIALGIWRYEHLNAQTEQLMYCVKKRSEFSRESLQEQFREGLKEIHGSSSSAGPTELRSVKADPKLQSNQSSVFTCSSREFLRLRGHEEDQRQNACFTDVEDTGIPALQSWCHRLPTSARENTAHRFITRLSNLTRTLYQYLDDTQDEHVSPSRRQLRMLCMSRTTQTDFKKLVNKTVSQLKQKFDTELKELTEMSAKTAAASAVQISNKLANEVHWNTYCATLRHHGTFRRDLNEELTQPMVSAILSSWSRLFAQDLLVDFKVTLAALVTQYFEEINDLSPADLSSQVELHVKSCVTMSNTLLKDIVSDANDEFKRMQREVSRSVTPHVKWKLSDGYDEVASYRGRGSYMRMKDDFREYLKTHKDEVFEGTADRIMQGLDQAAAKVGKYLQDSVSNLADTIHANVSLLWESAGTSLGVEDVRRQDICDRIREISQQMELWSSAQKFDAVFQSEEPEIKVEVKPEES